jgi:hypothetical protein
LNITGDSEHQVPEIFTKQKGHLVLSCAFFVQVTLMDEKMVRQDKVRYSGQVHLEKTRCFIAAVADKALVAPGAFRIKE